MKEFEDVLHKTHGPIVPSGCLVRQSLVRQSVEEMNPDDIFTGRISVFIYGLAGGAFTNLGTTLARSFSALGADVELVVLRATPAQLRLFSDIRVHHLNVSRSSRAPIVLARYLRRRRPQILLSMPTYLNIVALGAALIAKLEDTKVVITEHTSMANEFRVRSRGINPLRLSPLLVRFTYPHCAGLIGVSNDVLKDRELLRLFDVKSRPYEVIPNPITWHTTDTAIAPLHPWLSPRREVPTLLTLGRLAEQKGIDTLVRGIAELRERNISVRLLAFGEGELRRELEELVARLELGDRVALPGFTRDPIPLLRECDAFVLSSRWEGNPLALLEAMSCGCAIVSTASCSGITDVIRHGENGLLVPVDQPTLLADAIAKILSDRRLAVRLGVAAELTSRQFDPLQVGRQYLAFFNRILHFQSPTATRRIVHRVRRVVDRSLPRMSRMVVNVPQGGCRFRNSGG